MGTAQDIIERLDLQPHPEGGWFRETWRAPSPAGERGSATAIHFLLERGQKSHWHRVDAAEIWLWHAGDPLELWLAEGDDIRPHCVTLGPDVLAGQQAQHVIPAQQWQAARPSEAVEGYTLVSCIVSPAFEFSGFVLAEEGWVPGCGRPAR